MTARSHHAQPAVKHLISAIHFEPTGSPTVSTIRCECGYANSAPTPELLDLEWREHRRKVGAPDRTFSHTIRAGESDPLRRPRAMPSKRAADWTVW